MNVVIASAVRSPIASFRGAFASLKASRLGATVVKEAVSRAGVSPGEVDLVLMGNVLSAGMGQAPARQAALYAGLSETTPAVTLNKMCGSGLEAVIQAARAVALGDAKIAVAGGMESMSQAPYLLPKAREGLRMGHGELLDSMVHDGLWDVYGDKHMGSCAERCAREYSFSREAQDDYALRSYRRAQEANEEGYFEEEIVPVEVPGRKGEVTVVSRDEEPSRVDFAKLPTLRPVFEKGGSVTAGNASTINDGAAALVVCTEETARERGLPVMAKISGYAVSATDSEWFTVAPIAAMRTLFEHLGWQADEVNLYEINEAFAVVPMAAMQEFGLCADKVNVHGGAVALGHPIGASGARILATLLHALKRRGETRGVASICIGGGEALAMAVELVG
ncbi:MAG: thiolase family protein [Deinococcota bacterium]|jgi:acetyl-CoA C-acetyltransferase|nr:thiolase family protein [Deinococcota bacterium]